MRKKIAKITMIAGVIILAAFVSYLGYRKIEANKAQSEAEVAEMQNKLDAQQAKIDELQRFKTDQEQTNAQLSVQEFQDKKADCEMRLRKKQESLVSSQRRLGEYQTVVKYVETDNCPKEKTRLCDTVCYDDCLKQNDCSKSTCDDDIKKECKKSHEENLANIKKELADQAESVRRQETELQNIKNECEQYLN